MAYRAVCDFEIQVSDSGALMCEEWIIEYTPDRFSILDLDPVLVTGMFGAGMALFITPWAAAWGFSQLLKLIRYS